MPADSCFDFLSLVVNLGDDAKEYICGLDFNITKDGQFEFSSPILLTEDKVSVENDGDYLYHEFMFSPKITISQNNDDDNEIILSEIKFIIDCNDLTLDYYFKVKKGFFDGRNETIENINKTGIYLLNHKLHSKFDWWKDIKRGSHKIYRSAMWYDMKFLFDSCFIKRRKINE